MKTAIVFSDLSSLSEDEWLKIQIREELFTFGISCAFRLKDTILPTSIDGNTYIEDLAKRLAN